MTQTPYKICPRCGQATILEKMFCGRCNFAFPAHTFMPPPRVPVIQRSDALLLGALLVAFCVVGAIIWRANVATGKEPSPSLLASSSTRQIPDNTLSSKQEDFSPPQTPLVTAQGQASSSPFLERPSTQEIPTINIRGDQDDFNGVPDRVQFRNIAGQVFEMVVPAGQTSSMRLPAGNYEYILLPGHPRVQGQDGDATFRRYRQYDLSITTEHNALYSGPQHIGDD
jgi:hypothetical protein